MSRGQDRKGEHYEQKNMIEVLFGEGEAASMKAAKDKEIGTVICLGFMMDVGDIREPVDSLYRKELLYSMYAQNQWEQDKEMEEELKKVGDICSVE